jgi:type IV secretion system protein TrbL
MIQRIRNIYTLCSMMGRLMTVAPRPGFMAVVAAASVSFIGLALTTPAPVHAQLDTLLNPLTAIQSEASGWIGSAQSIAQGIFRTLFALEITFLGIQMALFRDNLGEFFGSVGLKILTAGFFLWLIQDGPAIFTAIINSFTQIATTMDGNAGANGLGQLIFEAGSVLAALAAANVVGKTESLTADAISSPFVLGTGDASLANLPNNNVQDIGVVQTVEFFLVICVAVIILQWILINIESSIVMGAGILFLGFAGSKFTMPFSQGYLSYAFNVGVKLFTLYLVLALEANLGKSVFATGVTAAALLGGDLTGIGGSAGVLILYYTCAITMIMAILAWYIPNFAGSFLSGQSSLNASTVMSSMMGAVSGLQAFNANKAASHAEGHSAQNAESKLAHLQQSHGQQGGVMSGGGSGAGGGDTSPAVVASPKGEVSSVGNGAAGAAAPGVSHGSLTGTGNSLFSAASGGGSNGTAGGSNSASNFGSGAYTNGSGASGGSVGVGGGSSAAPALSGSVGPASNGASPLSAGAPAEAPVVSQSSLAGSGAPGGSGSRPMSGASASAGGSSAGATPLSGPVASGGGAGGGGAALRGGSPGATGGGAGSGGYTAPIMGGGGASGAQNNPAISNALSGGGGRNTSSESYEDQVNDLEAQAENLRAAEQVQNAYALSALRLPTADPVPSAVSVRLGMPDKL